MWTLQSYARVRAAFPQGSRRQLLLRFLYAAAPVPIWCVYPCLVLVLWQTRDARLLKVVLVPAAVFGICTLVRHWLDRPRPSQMEGFEPVLDLAAAHAPGQSFPSRHVASAVVIALAAGYVNSRLGIGLGALAALIALVRVLGGAHHPRDVAAGAAGALLVGVIGLWVL